MSDLRMELIQGQLNDIEENVRSIKATWGNTIMTLDNIKTSLKADRQKAIDEAYHKGFEAGQHEATTLEYQQGLNDAWETITKIAKMPDGERMTHFGEVWISNILNAYSLEQIFTILEKSEFEPDEIKIGDEVESLITGRTYIIHEIDGKDVKGYNFKNQHTCYGDKNDFKKTGRHFSQVAELVKAMKEGAE